MTDKTPEQIHEEYVAAKLAYNDKWLGGFANQPEAGGVAYCTVYSSKGVAVNLTSRGVTPVDAAESLIDAITILSPRYKLSPEKSLPQAAAPVQNPSAKSIMQETAGSGGSVVATGEPVYEDVEFDGASVFNADIVKVLPQPDNKVTIEFWGAGRKYAELFANKWKLDAAQGLMNRVTSEPMSKAAEYRLPCRVYYKLGKEYTNKKGEKSHYKDVVAVRPM